MYNEFYGFSEKPFEVTLDPRFFYLTLSHQEALASMIDGIKKRLGFISIIGEVGTGKTALIYSLLNDLDQQVKTVLIFHTAITFEELIKNILLELDQVVVEKNKRDLLSQLNEYLLQKLAGDETLAVIIDEAQNLPKEVMRELGMLSELDPQISRGLQIVFVGQPEFEEKLNSQDLKQLKQRIKIKHQIRALSEEETKEYINYRLRLVGSSSLKMFTPKAISMICRYAQGIPRIINILCDNAFLKGYSLSIKRIDVDIIREVIKEIEGPGRKKTIFFSSTPVSEIRRFLLRSNSFAKKASLAILSLICLGGAILLAHRYLQQRSAIIWDIKSLKIIHVDKESSSISTSPQTKTEGLSKKDMDHPLGKPESVSSEFFQPGSPPTVSDYVPIEEDKLKAFIDVKKGQTISYLTQKYYGLVNETLIDHILHFNPEITDVNFIIVSQKIRIPKITEELLIIHSSEHTYKIHVGTFWTPDFARRYSDEPALKGEKIEILPRKVSPQDTWYRVVVGKFDNKNEAIGMINLLKKKGLLPSFGGLQEIE